MNRKAVARELLKVARDLVARRPKYSVFLKNVVISGLRDVNDSDEVDAALLKLYKQLGKNRGELRAVGYDVGSVVDATPVVTRSTVVVPIKFRGEFAEAEPVMQEVLDGI